MISKFANEKTTRALLESSAEFGQCCKTAPMIGGSIICIQHERMYVFGVDAADTKKCELLRVPREKMNHVLNHHKNAQPCPNCGAFFTVHEKGSLNLNSDPLQRCDDCDPMNVDLTKYIWSVIPRDALMKCCSDPSVEVFHDDLPVLTAQCATCSLTVFADVDIRTLDSIVKKGVDSPLLLILGLHIKNIWEDEVRSIREVVKQGNP